VSPLGLLVAVETIPDIMRTVGNVTWDIAATSWLSRRAGKVPLDALATHETTLEGAALDLPRWAHAKDGLIKAIITVGG